MSGLARLLQKTLVPLYPAKLQRGQVCLLLRCEPLNLFLGECFHKMVVMHNLRSICPIPGENRALLIIRKQQSKTSRTG